MSFARLTVLGAMLTMAPGCFSPDYTTGRLRCAAPGKACPDGYQCAPDGQCYRSGQLPDLVGASRDLAHEADLPTTATDLADTSDLSPSTAVLAVVVEGSGAGTVSSNPTGVDCPGTCVASFAVGTIVLTAAPTGAASRGPWTGCDSVTCGGSCVVDLQSARTVIANFVAGENCFDNVDNDGDDKIDCADEDCSSHVCRTVPGGWSGPVTLISGSSGTMDCPAPLLTAPQLRAGSDAQSAPAACSACLCGAATIFGGLCEYAEATTYETTDCTGNAYVTNAAECQGSFIIGSMSARFRGPLASMGAGCPPSGGDPTLPAPTWTTNMIACNVESPAQGGCPSDGRCMPALGTDERACVYKTGDVSCPGSPYTERFLYYTDFDDSRDCGQCTCSISSFSCSADIVCDIFSSSDTACSGTKFASVSLGPSTEISPCIAVPDNYRRSCSTSTLTGATCTPTKAVPDSTGTVDEKASAVVTVCCL